MICCEIKRVLEKSNAKIEYSPNNLLCTYLTDSLAFVQFIVDIEQELSVEIPFGSFDLSLLDKSISEAESFIQTIIKEKKDDSVQRSFDR